jgi:mannose-6-phosphate isomerase-like protein (cupin superfamily)
MSKMEIHNHEAEECYIIQSGSGEMLFKGGSRPVKVGDYIYLPSWCDHGIVNNGTEILVVLLALTPPNP